MLCARAWYRYVHVYAACMHMHARTGLGLPGLTAVMNAHSPVFPARPHGKRWRAGAGPPRPAPLPPGIAISRHGRRACGLPLVPAWLCPPGHCALPRVPIRSGPRFCDGRARICGATAIAELTRRMRLAHANPDANLGPPGALRSRSPWGSVRGAAEGEWAASIERPSA